MIRIDRREMARRSTLRASDADRERIAERLRNAASEGRLLAEELEQRLDAAFSARTYGELDPLVADLPEKGLPALRPGALARVRRPALAAATALAALAILAGEWASGSSRHVLPQGASPAAPQMLIQPGSPPKAPLIPPKAPLIPPKAARPGPQSPPASLP
jgi:hypothetical protein